MRTRLSLLGPVGIALLSAVSCTVDRAIEGQSRWFYRVMESEEYVIPLANGDSLSVLHTGQRPGYLVFVHGFWALPTGAMAADGVGIWRQKSMYIVDLLSFGASTSADSLISVPRQSESILAGLDSLGVSKFHLVGHSYGGMVSAYFSRANIPNACTPLCSSIR